MSYNPYLCQTGNITDMGKLQFSNVQPTAFVIYIGTGANQEEMLRISTEGFWVRGNLVPQDQNEAAAVYNAVCQWATWHRLSQP